MSGTRSALIVASYDYEDPGLRQLRAPARDAEALARVLTDADVGGFDVRTMLNEPGHVVSEAVEEFFADRTPDDLLLLYFSCHGVKDEDGELYFAASNTRPRRLGATGVAAGFVNRCMSRSRSRRVVLLLDCCYAGAFERGMAAKAGTGAHIEEHFGGRGRAVITATSAVEYAFEGDQLAESQQQQPSVFTSALVEGLETGDADRDQDGRVGLDELYDYVYGRVREVTPNQTPGKWMFGVEGELHIARRGRPVTQPAPLPPELQELVEHPLPGVRLAAIAELERLLQSQHAGRVLAAEMALAQLANDDSRRVAAAAAAALGARAQPPAPKTPRPDRRAPRADPAQPPPAAPAAGAPAPGPARSAVELVREALAADRLRLRIAALLAFAAAVLLVISLFPTYQAGGPDRPLGGEPLVLWPSLIMAAMALAAGICTLAPATRLLIGPGLLLGAAAGSAGWLVGLATLWVSQGGLGHGQSLQFAACSILVLAAGLVALELASTPGVGISMPSLESRLPLLVVALGAVAAVGVGINLWSLILLQGFDTEVVPNIWGIASALLVPAAAAAIAPRQLGAALLAGWIGAGPIVYVYYYVGLRVLTSHDLAPVVLAGSAVFALLLIVVRPRRLR